MAPPTAQRCTYLFPAEWSALSWDQMVQKAKEQKPDLWKAGVPESPQIILHSDLLSALSDKQQEAAQKRFDLLTKLDKRDGENGETALATLKDYIKHKLRTDDYFFDDDAKKLQRKGEALLLETAAMHLFASSYCGEAKNAVPVQAAQPAPTPTMSIDPAFLESEEPPAQESPPPPPPKRSLWSQYGEKIIDGVVIIATIVAVAVLLRRLGAFQKLGTLLRRLPDLWSSRPFAPVRNRYRGLPNLSPRIPPGHTVRGVQLPSMNESITLDATTFRVEREILIRKVAAYHKHGKPDDATRAYKDLVALTESWHGVWGFSDLPPLFPREVTRLTAEDLNIIKRLLELPADRMPTSGTILTINSNSGQGILSWQEVRRLGKILHNGAHTSRGNRDNGERILRALYVIR